MKTNLNLRKDYTNVTEGMSDKWIERFEKARNEKVVERLFDFLEEKITEESKKLNSLTEDLTINVAVRPSFNLGLEKINVVMMWIFFFV